MVQLSFFDIQRAQKSKKSIKLNVAVKPHIYKFIYFKENMTPGERIPLNKRYSLIMKILKNNIAKNKHLPGSMDLLEGYTMMLPVSGHIETLPYGRFLLSPASIREFNTMVYEIMMDHLFEKIKLNLILGKAERNTIWEFMEETGIDDEDLGYDSLLKSSQRYRQEMNIGTIEDLKQQLANKVSFTS